MPRRRTRRASTSSWRSGPMRRPSAPQSSAWRRSEKGTAMRKIIRGGTVVNASESVNADVLIEGETIRGVGTFDGVDAELIDATRCYVLPGAIDNHTRLSTDHCPFDDG